MLLQWAIHSHQGENSSKVIELAEKASNPVMGFHTFPAWWIQVQNDHLFSKSIWPHCLWELLSIRQNLQLSIVHGNLGQNRGQEEEQKRLKCIPASLFYTFFLSWGLNPSQTYCRFIIFLQSSGKYAFNMRMRIKTAPNNNIINNNSVPILLESVFVLL